MITRMKRERETERKGREGGKGRRRKKGTRSEKKSVLLILKEREREVCSRCKAPAVGVIVDISGAWMTCGCVGVRVDV